MLKSRCRPSAHECPDGRVEAGLPVCRSPGRFIFAGSAEIRLTCAILSRVLAVRPVIVAAAHCHSMYGKAWSSLGRLLDPLTQDSCAFFEDHALFDDYTGVVLDPAEGQRIAQSLGAKKAIILRN